MPTLGNTPRPAYVYDTETDTWVPVGVGAHTHAYIPNTLVDAKGDILTASANDVPAILSKGADGTILVADSTTSTGLAWQPYAAQQVAGKNAIINGSFDVWQRGTSYTPTNSSTQLGSADRWQTFYNGSAVGTNTVSRQTFTPGQTAVPGNPTYFIRTTTNGSATQNATDYYQRVEDVSTFAGQTVTLSFWAQASNSGTIALYIDQNFGSGGSITTEATPTPSSSNFTTTWAKYTSTFTLPSISGKTVGANNFVGFRIRNFSTLTSGTFDLAQVQLEVGPIATTFSIAGGTIQGELAACQRYYVRLGGGALYDFVGMGNTTSTSGGYVIAQFPSHMRSIPSSIDYSNLGIAQWGTSPVAVSSASILNNGSNASNKTAVIQFAGSGFPAGGTFVNMTGNASSGYIGFNAEL